jgi:hypothetical protein
MCPWCTTAYSRCTLTTTKADTCSGIHIWAKIEVCMCVFHVFMQCVLVSCAPCIQMCYACIKTVCVLHAFIHAHLYEKECVCAELFGKLSPLATEKDDMQPGCTWCRQTMPHGTLYMWCEAWMQHLHVHAHALQGKDPTTPHAWSAARAHLLAHACAARRLVVGSIQAQIINAERLLAVRSQSQLTLFPTIARWPLVVRKRCWQAGCLRGCV